MRNTYGRCEMVDRGLDEGVMEDDGGQIVHEDCGGRVVGAVGEGTIRLCSGDMFGYAVVRYVQ